MFKYSKLADSFPRPTFTHAHT